LSRKVIETIRSLLKTVDFLAYLDSKEMDAMIACMESRPCRKGDTIIRQGDPGDAFYILTVGAIEVERDGKFVTRLEKGTYIGEMALLSNRPRSATVRAVEEGELYCLPREAFTKILMHNSKIAAVIQQTAAYRQAQDRDRAINAEA